MVTFFPTVVRVAALTSIALLLVLAGPRSARSATVLFDNFARQDLLDGSMPTVSNPPGTWQNPGNNWATIGTQALLAQPGENSRANYPVTLTDGAIHTLEIEVDVADGQGTNWMGMGFAWSILSDTANTGVGPSLFLSSEDADVDVSSFILAGSGRVEHNFGEGALGGVDFTNSGRVTMVIDARGQDDTVQFFFNDHALGAPTPLFPVSLNIIKGVFISGLAEGSVHSISLVSAVPEPSAMVLTILSLLGLLFYSRHRSGRSL